MKSGREMVSLGLLIAALLLFVAFHFTHSFGNGEWGWRVWLNLWEVLEDPKSLKGKDAVTVASFLNFSFLIVVSPFLKNVWSKSQWAWWGAVIFSGLAGAVFWVMYFLSSAEPPEAGGWSLLLAPIFNFTGLLLSGARSPERGLPASKSGESAR